MSLNDVIRTFRVPYAVNVTRQAAETYVLGRVVPDPSPTILVLNTTEFNAGSVVPVSGQETQQGEEGQSAENTRIMYSMTALRARSPQGPADIVSLHDGQYAVVSVKDWSGLVGDGTQNCWECVLAKQEKP